MAKNNDFFQKFNTEPDYKDVENLQKFLSARMKVVGRDRSGLNAKNQKKLTQAIKYARYLALIPYTSYQNAK